MHRSKLPLTVWFWGAHLMTTHSNGMSAVQLEAQRGITYKTAWLLAQKLRRSMIDPQLCSTSSSLDCQKWAVRAGGQ